MTSGLQRQPSKSGWNHPGCVLESANTFSFFAAVHSLPKQKRNEKARLLVLLQQLCAVVTEKTIVRRQVSWPYW